MNLVLRLSIAGLILVVIAKLLGPNAAVIAEAAIGFAVGAVLALLAFLRASESPAPPQPERSTDVSVERTDRTEPICHMPELVPVDQWPTFCTSGRSSCRTAAVGCPIERVETACPLKGSAVWYPENAPADIVVKPVFSAPRVKRQIPVTPLFTSGLGRTALEKLLRN